MLQFTAFISAIILLGISVIHVYWAFGGKWAMDAVLPQTQNEALVFKPGMSMTLLVALVFATAALLPLALLNVNSLNFSPQVLRGGIAATVIVFGLRAMGEFRYVGFFKKIKDTTFGRNDTRYFSPLCLFVSLINIFIYFNF